MSAIEASSVRCKTLADGSLDVTLRIEPRDAVAAFTLLSAPGTPVALAALKTAAQASQERAKGGEAAKWLGIRCGEPAFLQWLAGKWPADYRAACRGELSANEVAAFIVRNVCDVQSRAEIDNDPFAFARFDKLIRKPWLQHSGGAA